MIVRSLRKNTRGGALVEFSLTALVMVFTILTTIEFGVEMFVRQSSERVANTAAATYAETRSKAATNEAMRDAAPVMMRRCAQPVKVQLYNTIRGKDLTGDTAGFKAMDNGGDASAEAARVTFTCQWNRITPLARGIFGPEFTHSVTIYTRMRT